MVGDASCYKARRESSVSAGTKDVIKISLVSMGHKMLHGKI